MRDKKSLQVSKDGNLCFEDYKVVWHSILMNLRNLSKTHWFTAQRWEHGSIS